MSKKLYIISDGEEFYPGFPGDQPSPNNPPQQIVTLKQARLALKEWSDDLGYYAQDDIPSPLYIYELKKVK